MGLQSFGQEKVISSLSIGAEIPLAGNGMPGVDNKSHSLAELKTEKGLLVIFSCNTCPFVVKSQTRTQEMLALSAKLGIGVAIINSNEAQRTKADSYDEMLKYAKEQKYTAPYLIDNGMLADAFGATRTPEVFLFSGNGKLVYKGAMEDNPTQPSSSKSIYLKTAMNNMVQGKAIDPDATKSIGCTIKRI